ncbi:MAG: prepilin peptidase [Nitrososphaerales archaeon]
MLSYASYSDWKKREVDDRLWILFSFIGITLNIIELFPYSNPQLLILIITSISLSSLISFILYYFGFFGGADMKVLIAISLIIPVYYPSNYLHPFTSLTSLTNGIFFTISLPPIFLILNIIRLISGKDIFSGFEGERLWRKILVCFLGYRASKADKSHFLMSLEKIADGKKRFHISFLKDEDFISGQDIWVTPGIPLLIFISLGFISIILYGDFLTLLFRY